MDIEAIKLMVDLGGWGVAIFLVARVAPLLKDLARRLGEIEAHDRSQRASLLQLVLLVAVQAGMDPATIEAEIRRTSEAPAGENGKPGDQAA